MKNIRFNRKRLLRAIHAACVALFFAACASRAAADPSHSGEFSVSGSTVTVSASADNPSTAYFSDPSSAGYAITIQSNATIGNNSDLFHSGNLISFDHGSVNNAGTLTASNYAIVINSSTATSTVINSGSITSSEGGVYLKGNGTVDNLATGTLSGGYPVYITGAGTVNNAGRISSTGTYAVYLGSGTVNNTGSISSTIEEGVLISGTGTVANSSSISGFYDGVKIEGDGTVTNKAGGTISAGYTNGTSYGLYIGSTGTITNGGTIESLSHLTVHSSSSLSNYGLYVGGNGSVTNTGSILGGYNTPDGNANYGLYIAGNGTVTNSSSGTISGYYSYGSATGIYIGQKGTVTNSSSIYGGDCDGNAYGIEIVGNGTVVNSGSISAKYAYDSSSANGVYLSTTGTVINSGSISASHVYGGSAFGVHIAGTGTVINSGSISASNVYGGPNYGIYIGGNGTVTNQAGGTISGGYGYGVDIVGSGTNSVTNAGTISGRYAVDIDDNGSVINAGTITGNNAGIYIGENGTVVNTGTITATSSGIYIGGTGTVTLAGGSVVGPDAVVVNGDDTGAPSTVTVVGRSNINGLMVASGVIGTLKLNLVGLTPALLAELATLQGVTSDSFSVGRFNYGWYNLALDDQAVSLEEVVDPGLVNAAIAVDNATSNPSNVGLPSGFDPFYLAATSNPEAAMNKLVGREINQAFDTLVLSYNTTLASNVHQHLDDLLSSDQLAGLDLGSLHVSEIGSSYAMGDTTAQLSNLVNAATQSSLAGTTMSTDNSAPTFRTSAQPRWGTWISGNVSIADQSSTSSLSGFHSTIGSPTLGVDIRVTPHLVLGLLASYTTGDARFGDGSDIDLNSGIAAFYGAWRQDNWHVDAIAGGGITQYSDTRATFATPAHSSPRGDDILTDSTVGYDFNPGDQWSITPEAGLQYTHLQIGSFTETGAGLFDLSEGGQNIDSLRSHLGFTLDKAWTIDKNLTFVPELRAQWYHEFMDNSRGISTSLPGTPALGSFSVNTLSPDRDFALVGVGLNTAFTGYNGMPVGLFLNYNLQAGQTNYLANSANAGLRVDY